MNVKLMHRGEAGEKTPEEVKSIRDKWKTAKSFPLIEEHDVKRECITSSQSPSTVQ